METLPTFNFVSIGNGIYARRPLTRIEQYRQLQATCPHAKKDPANTCYRCGKREVK